MSKEKTSNIRKSNNEIGRQRDERVVATVELVGSLTREQIQKLFFKDIKKCQRRLKVLYDKKKLQRGRCDVSNSYCYWAKKKPGRIDHTILCNWVYVAAINEGIKVTAWIREYKTPCFIADSFTIFSIDGRYEPIFVEMQRKVNHSNFDKVPKYIDYFESAEWVDKKWAQTNNKGQKVFPRILVVTDGDTSKLENIIKEENRIGLRFIVVSLQDLNLRKCLQ